MSEELLNGWQLVTNVGHNTSVVLFFVDDVVIPRRTLVDDFRRIGSTFRPVTVIDSDGNQLDSAVIQVEEPTL